MCFVQLLLTIHVCELKIDICSMLVLALESHVSDPQLGTAVTSGN